MAALDAPYDRAEALARELWGPAWVSGCGDGAQRLADLNVWAQALTRGELPDDRADFGDRAALSAMRAAVASLRLEHLCQGSPGLSTQLLRTLLWHLDRINDLQPRLARERAVATQVAAFKQAWQIERADWEQVLALLQGLGDLANLSWDALRGRLNSRDWREAQRISGVLAGLPALRELMRQLGRSERGAAPKSPSVATLQHSGPRPMSWRTATLPNAPGEVLGIRHSSQIEHMLGSEAALIRHPVLRKLWRARHAEARLLIYDSQAVLTDLRPEPQPRQRAAAQTQAPQARQRGPFIVCLDTSGSMRGAPENIAKAVALQAFRTAHQEQRGCLLVAFGGPGEIVECELGLGAGGLDHLLHLMGQSFDGGTDVQGPLERAIERVHQRRWADADLLVVSDGEFGCTPQTLAALDQARAELGLRVQGILVGDRETMGLMEVCDHIHWVRDWRDHGRASPGRGFSPVHSKSLTALYFPNALSPRAARHKPTSG